MRTELTQGNIVKSILVFSAPMLIGNILQQCYNMADTYIVGKYLGSNALAAVGSSYSLMTFILSIVIGLCVGASTLVAISYGQQDKELLHIRLDTSFVMIGICSILLELFCIVKLNWILTCLKIPVSVWDGMVSYSRIVIAGILLVFIYNFFSCMLRAVGNSVMPLLFLGLSSILNIVLDIVCIQTLHLGIEGAAYATILSQFICSICISGYCYWKERELFPRLKGLQFSQPKDILYNSFGACIQQSIMNFGILLIQGLVNTFGPLVMAAFAIGVKIDTFAYMPVQEFGNAFSIFVSQNYGARNINRIHEGIKSAWKIITLFSVCLSFIVFINAELLISIFTDDLEVIRIGSEYLKIEGFLYIGIGFLFLFYGFFRAVKKPQMSIILTVVSLGTRVCLSYVLSSSFGYSIIWYTIPIGWVLADLVGYLTYKRTII